MVEYRKKLIEVALPLESINTASTRENYIYKGNPSAIHKWWSGKPLATCRAVLFASLITDPSSMPEEFPTEQDQQRERDRLFKLIEALVQWENSNNEEVISLAREEILKSTGGNPPLVFDPFAGGGSIPLEAQRLGLEAYASDLNPVAVLINKALIEIPPKFATCPPINPESRRALIDREWRGAQGLADDIRYYGRWMRDEAEQRIGYLYPKVTLPKEYGGNESTIIAWLWVRSVACPNPACGAQMPLTSKWWLSTKKGKEVWIEPQVDNSVVPPAVHFIVRSGKGTASGGTVNRQGAKCIACGKPVAFDYIRREGQSGRMGVELIAIATEHPRGRVYLSPSEEQVAIAKQAHPVNVPETDLPEQALGFRVQLYGMTKHRDLFTARQLVALSTFSEIVKEVREKVWQDAVKVGLVADKLSLDDGEVNATAYADAIATYLAFVCDKYAMYGCSLVPWYTREDRPSMIFGSQKISMVWDFAEVNPFTDIGGSLIKSVAIVADSVEALVNNVPGLASQKDAATIVFPSEVIVSTDPPYYDNVPYADLSDFFYVWLRSSLANIYPNLFKTLLVPKNEELVADPYRYGGKSNAEHHFLAGMKQAFSRIRLSCNQEYPLTVYYAFKQSEKREDKDEISESAFASSGWETMLEGLIQANFVVTGTWPMRTERSGRMRDTGSNALASSIVLVCRPRPVDVKPTTRRDFLNALNRELPKALKDLQRGNIAPVDLAQAAIGPGMAIFSRYSKVLESDGAVMRVRTALQLINQTLDEVLAEQEGEYDTDTRWALAWFEQFGVEEGPYGVAETLSKAKNTSVGALVEAGILEARGGKVRLLRRNELSGGWNPTAVKRLAVWEVTQRLIRALQEQGDQGAAAILYHVGTYGEAARDLAYRLYTTCERKKWAEEAMAYNSLVVEWPDISGELERLQKKTTEQAPLF